MRILCFYDTVSALIGESFALYRSSLAKWLCMLYVPAVVGAVGFVMYVPVASVVWSAMVIGESAVNDTVFEPIATPPAEVSLSTPLTLYTAPLVTVVGSRFNVSDTLCLSVL